VALLFTFLALPASAPYYRRFVGEANPVLAVVVASLVGGACLAALKPLGGFAVLQRDRLVRGLATAAGLATLFAAAIVVADLALRYPIDLNAPLPQALVFYPSIGLVAEVAFHLVPLTAVLLLLLPLRHGIGSHRRVAWAIAIVAVAEPTFQVLLGGGALTTIDVYTALHVFAFALAQLYIFRRYDFMAMFAMRLVYYLYWHIAWGWLRLDILA
jgi:hypothetical protein